MNIINVELARNKTIRLSYYIDNLDGLSLGSVIIVPFRNHFICAMLVEINPDNIDPKIIPKLKILKNEQVKVNLKISNQMIDLIKRSSDYYLFDYSDLLKLTLPINLAMSNKLEKFNQYKTEVEENFDKNFIKNITLSKISDAQKNTLDQLRSFENNTSLLFGAMGSGKTEIYFHLIKQTLETGKKILLMLPELAITAQIAKRFENQFHIKPIIWHSGISDSKKLKYFASIISSVPCVVIGTRSSLFLPYKDLGLIIVDEEHDNSYKQDSGVLYNGRDMAVLRGKIENIPVILGSATPSLETFYNAKQGKYKIAYLNNNFYNISLPTTNIVDTKQDKMKKYYWLSKTAYLALEENLENKEQSLVFLNRRGYAPIFICNECFEYPICPSCDISLVVHKKKNILSCHYCEYKIPLPSKCFNCEASDFSFEGIGVEKIVEDLQKIFKKANVEAITREETRSAKNMNDFLGRMSKGEIDIIVGTQVITKSYHFSNLSLAIVIESINNANIMDFRTSESQYQLLKQLQGRAGREKPGKFIIQTYDKKHNILNSLAKNDDELFLKKELSFRINANMPPITRITAITISSNSEKKTFDLTQNFIYIQPKLSKDLINKYQIKILGPVEHQIFKLKKEYRYQIIIIANKNFNIQKYLKIWKEKIKLTYQSKIKIDIDPYL